MTPMTPTELNALAEKVEALDGPDRGADADIELAIGNWTAEHHEAWWNYEAAGEGANPPMYAPVPPQWFTASLDQAMTLALPTWWFSASLPLSPDAYGYSREELRMPRAAFEMIDAPYMAAARAATLPLAIVAACLKGRAASLLTEEGA